MVKLPFILIEQSQPGTGKLWYLAGLGLQRMPVFRNFPRSKMALHWKYAPVAYLGNWMLNLITQETTWKSTIKNEPKVLLVLF